MDVGEGLVAGRLCGRYPVAVAARNYEKGQREGRAWTIEEGELRNEAYWKMVEERVGGLADLTGL